MADSFVFLFLVWLTPTLSHNSSVSSALVGTHWRLSLALLTPCVESRVCRNGAVDACAVSKAWKAAETQLQMSDPHIILP